jgi:hypothetical protein
MAMLESSSLWFEASNLPPKLGRNVITVFGTYVEVPSVPDLEDLLKLAPLRAPSFADGADTDDSFTGLAFFGFETTASLTSSTKVTLRGSPFFRRGSISFLGFDIVEF